MNPLRWWIPLAATVVMILGACATSPISRIDGDRTTYESWPIDVREAVLNGQAKKGMTKEQVEMALGKPAEVVTRAGDDEVWIYRKSEKGSLLQNTGVTIGGGMGGVNIGGGGGGGGGTPEEREVVFGKGLVVRSDFESGK